MANRQVIRVALLVAVVHFFVTSLVGYYAAYRVGGSAGENIAQLFIDAYESDGRMSEQTIDERYRDLKKKADATADRWQAIFVLISLPIGFVIEPMFKPVTRGWYDRALANELSMSQLKVRVYMLLGLENLLNSASLGLLVYLALRMAMRRHAP